MLQLRLITSIKEGKNKIKAKDKYPIIRRILEKLVEKVRFKIY